jgi:hypothetical protein
MVVELAGQFTISVCSPLCNHLHLGVTGIILFLLLPTPLLCDVVILNSIEWGREKGPEFKEFDIDEREVYSIYIDHVAL